MEFKDVKGNGFGPLEITLFKGASIFRTTTLAVYAPRRKTKRPGRSIVGYVHKKDDFSLLMVGDRLPGFAPVLGWCEIYKEAIHSIRQLGPSADINYDC